MTSVLWFGAVGAAAAAVHFGIVWWLVGAHGWWPLAANVVAFAVAFGVSFAGHRLLTFAAQRAPLGQALRRFAVVACSSFALNELMYALLLWAGWDYRLALLVVLLAVAVLTYVASRWWAFKGGEVAE